MIGSVPGEIEVSFPEVDAHAAPPKIVPSVRQIIPENFFMAKTRQE